MTGTPAKRPARILLVEDDLKLASLVREFLGANGFEVDVEPRGDLAAGRIVDEQPDLVILDLMLPGMDGLSVCREVRTRYPGPILMLTALGDEVDEVVGLELGADDYLAKPVRPRLLLARIHSLMRRLQRWGDDDGAVLPSGGEGAEAMVLGGLVVDASRRIATLDGREIALTTAEFDLLWFLARRAGETVTRDEIYEGLRGIEWDGLDRSVDLRVARLRRKLGDDARQPRRIKSVRGTGYLLVVDP